MEVMRVARQDAVDVLHFCGYKGMGAKSDKELSEKIGIVPEILPDDPQDGRIAALVTSITAHFNAGGKEFFEVYSPEIAKSVGDVPAPTVPAPTVPAPTVPAPTVPAPTVPAPTVPAPTVPAPTVSAPEEAATEKPKCIRRTTVSAPEEAATEKPKCIRRTTVSAPEEAATEKPKRIRRTKEQMAADEAAGAAEKADKKAAREAAKAATKEKRQPKEKPQKDVMRDARSRRGKKASAYVAGEMFREFGIEGGITPEKMARYRVLRGDAVGKLDKWYLTTAWNAICGYFGDFPAKSSENGIPVAVPEVQAPAAS